MKAEAKRDEIADRIADYLLAEGLAAASLRPLAAAAKTSDRMLLYYFKDKETLIGAALRRLATRQMAMLAAMDRQPPKSAALIEAEFLALTGNDALWPFMCVWLEVAALAARGDRLYRSIGYEIASGFRHWIASLLALDGEPERQAAATRILRTVEGAILLRSVGLTG
jgi:AcrR family transcriptional regulator